MKRTLLVLAALALAGLLAATAVVLGGLYDISATDQHLRPTYRVLDLAMRQSVRLRAASIEVPPLGDPVQVERGLAIYRDHCVQCHGAPGVAPQPFALGLTPAAANLAHTARHWRAAELYWAVRYGFKMTAMPAWEFRLEEPDLWAVVAFLRTLPGLSPQAYRQRAEKVPAAERSPSPDAAPDASRGRRALRLYGCATCHAIPGIVGADPPVAAPLEGMASRAVIAGILPNTPENLVRWIRFPRSVNPVGAMPDLGVSERDARDMGAYLATLR